MSYMWRKHWFWKKILPETTWCTFRESYTLRNVVKYSYYSK
jgi:hypothetical protein